MKKRKNRTHQRKAKKKRDKKYKGAAAQSARAKSEDENNSYVPAIDYLSGYRANMNIIANQLTSLTSPWYESSISNALSGMNSKLADFGSFESMLPWMDKVNPISEALSFSREATLSYAQLSNPMTVDSVASLISPTTLDESMSIFRGRYPIPAVPAFSFQGDNNPVRPLIDTYGVKNLSAFAIQSDLARGTEYSLLAEKSLSNLPWSSIGQMANLTAPSKELIGSSFLGLSESYSGLLESYVSGPSSYAALTPALRKHAPEDYYVSAFLLGVVSKEEEQVPEEAILNTEIQYENEVSLAEHLPMIHPGLYRMWKGAIETFNSSNSDRQRQFITSIRELYTHVMHELAPNEKISLWTDNEKMFDEKGRPTRNARLSYIYRNISNDSLCRYMKKEVQATTAFIDVFQKGTHSIDDRFSQGQLIAIKSKAETTLKLLLEIEFSVNRSNVSN